MKHPVIILAAVLAAGNASAAEAPAWQTKVHPLVLERTAAGAAEFLLVLQEQADLTPVAALRSKLDRGTLTHEILTEVATRTQPPLIDLLESAGVEYRPYWIANMIWVRADAGVLKTLAGRDEVLQVDANPRVQLTDPVGASGTEATAGSGVIEWGILKILADQVWSMGYTGTDVVIGGQDTGYDWTHPALIEQYRGWDGVSADHDYNWHDSIHTGGGVCGPDSSEPCDDHSHGTHTMGTMVGDDGGTNRIGVGPGARWIGCRNMDEGNGTPASYAECFEWFVAPTDSNGLNPNPALAPHLINNSWSCPDFEGCSFDTLQTVVENTRAAGIVVVASAGNSGSGCSSVNDPPAIYEAAFSVGATDSADNIASFSSRGPVTIDESDRLKPNVSAPGVAVRSSVPGGGYATFQGTSMAGPHVAGLLALLFDARPDLIGQVHVAERIVEQAAVGLSSTQDCGEFPGTEIPNPVFGHGRIDALATLLGDADGDGTDNLSDCAPIEMSLWTAPGPALALRVENNILGTGLFWEEPASGGGHVVKYDVLRSLVADDFSTAECIASNTPSTTAFEFDDPTTLFFYLVRAKNDCGSNLGLPAGGTPRQGPDCP